MDSRLPLHVPARDDGAGFSVERVDGGGIRVCVFLSDGSRMFVVFDASHASAVGMWLLDNGLIGGP